MRIAVTGAFGYSGRYIAKRLLEAGHDVIALTNSLRRPNPFGGNVAAFPFHFDEPHRLRDVLRGVQALVNTYWVRFDHRLFTHEQAAANSKVLFAAAGEAGVERIVHVSITNPDPASDLPYFRGKAAVEAALIASGVSWCILRPAVLFGKEDVLINNLAWTLRHLPAVAVFGDGSYRLQPIHVDDLARAAAENIGAGRNEMIEAIGPETFTYRELVAEAGKAIGVRRPIVSVPPALGYWGSRLIGLLVRDVVVTREEIRGLMEGRLCVDAPPLGTTKLTEWMRSHRDTLGRRYHRGLPRFSTGLRR
jgi:NADH dehydrogenase